MTGTEDAIHEDGLLVVLDARGSCVPALFVTRLVAILLLLAMLSFPPRMVLCFPSTMVAVDDDDDVAVVVAVFGAAENHLEGSLGRWPSSGTNAL